jgi:glycosyltransferase involved in cell wall biosynthesis
MLLRIASVAAQLAPVHYCELAQNSALLPKEFAGIFGNTARFDLPPTIRVRSAPRLAAGLRAFRRHIHRLETVACIAFTYPAAVRMAMALAGSGINLLWRCNYPVRLAKRSKRLRRMLALQTITLAGATAVCPSRFMANELADLGFPRGRIRVVHNGVDVDRFARIERDPAKRPDLRRRLGLPEADLVVACVARIDPVKNHSLLFRAVELSRRQGVRVALVCVGEADLLDRDYANRLRAETQTLGIADQVHWAGRQEDVAPWLGAADVFALASHAEGGTPSALLEAGAAGLPLLATPLGCDEVVLPGRTGLVFDATDAEGCAAAMLHMARNHADRLRFGNEAQRHVRASFGMERLTTEWLEIFERLLQVRGATERSA